MKKIFKLLFFISVCSLTLIGCGVKSADGIVEKVKDKMNKCNSYYVEGKMDIINNEDTYTYDVKVSYQKGDYYKISLVNTLNNHEQVILRNDDGVYVVTPSLNKSFKFQSDWPYNNSQIYLINSVVEDLLEDEDRVFKKNNDGYYFQSDVNYPNNKSLVKQNIYLNEKLNFTKVEVINKAGDVQIKMNFSKIDYNRSFDKDYFELSKLIKMKDNSDNSSNEKKDDSNSSTNNNSSGNATNEQNGSSTNDRLNEENGTTSQSENNGNVNNNTNSNENNNVGGNSTSDNTNDVDNNTESSEQKTDESNKKKENTKQTSTINDVIYPMYLPTNTTLANKEVINTDNGERLILTFEGDNPFVLVEETVSYYEDGLVIPVNGSLDFLTDVIGVINDNSVSFDSNGVEYYIVSNNLEKEELVSIARSISVLPVSK